MGHVKRLAQGATSAALGSLGVTPFLSTNGVNREIRSAPVNKAMTASAKRDQIRLDVVSQFASHSDVMHLEFAYSST